MVKFIQNYHFLPKIMCKTFIHFIPLQNLNNMFKYKKTIGVKYDPILVLRVL